MGWFTIWKILRHYAAAVELRASLLMELDAARKAGHKLPSNLGRQIWRQPHVHEEYLWLLRFITNDQPVTLIDIGGNSGYWAERFLTYFPDTDIHAFEPIPEMYNAYTDRLSGYARKHLYNVALGDEVSTATFNISEDYVHSSFHRYDGALRDKNAFFSRKAEIQVVPLDNFQDDIVGNNIVVKIDVQGFEGHVVRGGLEVLGRAEAMILECSFIKEFEGQLPTFIEAASLLRSVGLHPVQFGVFERVRGPMAYERNVLFVKEALLDQVLGYSAGGGK